MVQYFQWNLGLALRKWIFKAFDLKVQNVEEWTWKKKIKAELHSKKKNNSAFPSEQMDD